MIRKVFTLLQLTRPVFLLGTIILFTLGVVVGWRFHPGLLWSQYLIGIALVWSIQLTTHYINEYSDIDSDRVNTQRTWFSGGSGILSSGILPERTAFWFGIFFSITALLFIVLISSTSIQAAIIGMISLFIAWAYSIPPFRLSGSGMGEFAASLVVAVLVPLLGYLLQSGVMISSQMAVILGQLFLVHYAMLVAFEFPDHPADQLTEKKTLAVRLGLGRAFQVHNMVVLASIFLIFVFVIAGYQPALWLLLSLPLSAWQMAALRKYTPEAPPNYSFVTFRAVALFTLSTVLWIIGSLIILS